MNSEKQTEIEKLKDELQKCREEKNFLEGKIKILQREILNQAELILNQAKTRTKILQLILQTFWVFDQPAWLIGKLYKQYIGYTYEIDGWNVDYSNRDLICKKDNSILVIQCKKWSKRKNIEKDCISQLINAIETYKNKKCFQDKEVKGILYTTTNLSDSAMQLAQEKHIEIKANFPLDKNFPCIKCKNEENGKSYYYLPFNKQYFDIKLDLKNKDCYCSTIQEAEKEEFTYIGK